MNISSPFITRPIATSLLMVAIFLSGLLAFRFLPVSSLPEVDYPTMQVITYYPGASPKIVASSITSPLERQLGQMPGLSQMYSSSSSGLSLITLQFNLELSLDVAEQSVQAAINTASGYLPPGLPSPPVYSKVNPADAPIISLAMQSTNLPLSKVEDFAETRIAQKISQISGIGLVTISGGQRPAIRIKANSNALAAYGLSTSDIRTAVANANINAAKGNFDGDNIAYTINANDQLLTSEDYENLIISYVNNSPIRIKNVAKVFDDVENVKQAAWVNNEEAIIINIQKQPGSNVIKAADEIKNILPKLTNTLPKDIKITVLSDRTKTIRASVFDTKLELLLSIFLVVAVIYCFIRNFSATIIPSVAIPLSLIGTISFMYFWGFSINNLTLMALTIATGFVVDDAIVMIENIERYIEMGEKPLAAAFKGAGQIGFTIISLTVSLVAVLIPLFFMEDVIGRLFREFAITLAITIIISAFVSLTLTPMMCSLILKPHKKSKNKVTIFLENILQNLIDRYGIYLKKALSHQREMMGIFIFTLILTGILFYIIPKGFFPTEDTNLIQAISEISQDSSFTKMKHSQEKITKLILEDRDVESVSSFVGIDGTNITINTGRILINLKAKSERKSNLKKIIKRIKEKVSLSLNEEIYLQPIEDLSIDNKISRSRYQYSITSHDTKEVSQYAELLINELKLYPQLSNITSDQQPDGRETHIEINRDKASSFGITMQNITDSLYDIFGQRQISTIFSARNQYHVILEGLPALQKGKKSLDNIYVKSSNNKMVPLKNFAKFSERQSNLVITRQNQFPVSTITFDTEKNYSLGKAVSIVNEAVKKISIPEHMDKNFQGTALAFVKSSSNQGWLIVASIVVVYLVLGILYESYIHPITILSTLPSACLGALLALIVFGKDLDVVSIIGIILLIGIVKKNAIMMIDFALEQQRKHRKSPIDAIYEACILRFRPILMTTMAALLGAVPLVTGGGVGSEIRSPLGISIIAGLIFSQLLTLFTTPVIYLAFDKYATRYDTKLQDKVDR